MQIKNVIIGLLAATSMALTGCGDDGGGSPAGCEGTYSDEVNFDLTCEVEGFAMGEDALVIPVSLVGTTATQPTAGSNFEICVETGATLGQNIADLILLVGGPTMTTSVTLEDFTGTAAIVGAAPATVPLALDNLPQTVEFDEDGDGVGNPVDLDFDPIVVGVTSDGSPTVELSLDTMQVVLTDVPVIATGLTINVPSQPGDLATCAFPDPMPTVVLDML